MSIKDNSYGLAPLQEKMLDILKCFIDICNQYRLHYCVIGGTCIGALRHQGFIPWDDDLDVCMPRSDYERLWKIVKGEKFYNKYQFCRSDKEHNYHYRIIRLVDTETTFINRRCINEDIAHGIYIDIIPLDGCETSFFKRQYQIMNSVIYSVYNVSCLPEFNGGILMRLLVKLMLSLVSDVKKRYEISKKAEKRMLSVAWEDTTHVVELTTNFKALCTPYPKEWFCFDRKSKFEDIEVIIPTKAESYLTLGFGDYMKLPPENERHARHNVVFVDLNHSYRKYKGKYYCLKD